MESLNFDLTPVEELVVLDKQEYILREATGDVAVRYRNEIFKHTKLGPDGKPSSVAGMAEAEPLLVSLCLFRKASADGRLAPVSIATIKSWKQRVQKALAERIKVISDMEVGDDDTAEGLRKTIADAQEKLAKLNAKNGISATETTSD